MKGKGQKKLNKKFDIIDIGIGFSRTPLYFDKIYLKINS